MSMENRLSEKTNSELDLAEVMAQIRRDAQKRKLQSFHTSGRVFSPFPTHGADLRQTSSLRTPDPLPPALKMQPELERREKYEIGYLLGFHDEQFIRYAYETILKREPDDAGFAQYVKDLRSGRYSKIDILRSLRFSAEGRKANVTVHGLSKASLFRKIYRVPVVGYVAQLITAVFRLPVLIANYRRLETHTAAQFDRVANHVNEVVSYFAEANQRQSEINRQQMEEIQAQLAAGQQRLETVKNSLSSQMESVLSEHEKFIQEHNALNVDLSSLLNNTAEQSRAQSNSLALQAAELQTLKTQIDEQVQMLTGRLQNLRMDIAQQENRLGRLIADGDKAITASARSVQPQPLEVEQDHLLHSLYRSLEDGLRGTAAEIRDEVKVYLPVLHTAGVSGDVLDVGCGRGEWLQVLRDAGIQARGIDSNPILIRQCKELDLDVIEAEALAYLRSLEDQTLSAVTALHFAEHLELPNLVSFLDEAARTLKPQGLLILETPNPENLLVGSCNFYLDPTHKNPIPIPTMKLLVEARGFLCQDVMKLHPVSTAQIEVKDQLTSHFNHYLYGPMNYAVVARKPLQG